MLKGQLLLKRKLWRAMIIHSLEERWHIEDIISLNEEMESLGACIIHILHVVLAFLENLHLKSWLLPGFEI